MADDYLIIGQVTSSWGNKGEVKVYILTDFPDRFAQLNQISWFRDDLERRLTIEQTRKHKGMILVKFSGIDTVSEAEKLKQGYLRIPIDARVPLPEGHFYHFEIIGMAVVDRDGTPIGCIRDILETGSNDIYVIDRGAEVNDLLLPALKSVVLSVDTDKKVMTVEVPSGLD